MTYIHSILHGSRRPDISVARSGRIDLSARIAQALSLRPGDVVDVACVGSELYLYAKLRAADRVGRHQATVWPVCHSRRSPAAGTFRLQSVRLATALLSAAYPSANTSSLPLRVKLPCGTATDVDSLRAIPIIIRNPLPL